MPVSFEAGGKEIVKYLVGPWDFGNYIIEAAPLDRVRADKRTIEIECNAADYHHPMLPSPI